jgi:hypothetical protein
MTRPLVDITLILTDGTRIPVDTVYTGHADGSWQWHITTDLQPFRRRVAGAHVQLGPSVYEQTAADLGINPP